LAIAAYAEVRWQRAHALGKEMPECHTPTELLARAALSH